VRRIPAAARWCALAAFANALVWSLVTPPFHVPDETVHVSYVQYLAETGRVPNNPGATVFSEEEARTLEALSFNSVVGRTRDRPVLTREEQERVEQVERRDLGRVSGGGTAESSSQPPLFYAYESIGYLASPWRGLLDRVALMRALSALLAALTVLFVFAFLRELFPQPWAPVVGALVVAFQPVFGFVSSGVTPDAMLFAASAALFFALARAFRSGLTVRRGAGIGAALAIGSLAKLNFLALVPGALLGVALLAWRARRTLARRDLALGATLAVAIPAAAGLAYVALNLLVWDRSAWGGGVDVAARVASGEDSVADPITLSGQLGYTWQLYLPRLPFMDDQFAYFPPWETWFRGMVGVFGWLDTRFELWVSHLAFAIVAPLIVLLLVGLFRVRGRLRGALPEIVTFAAVAVGLLVSIGLLGLRYRSDTGFTFEQARYLLPLLPLYGAAAAGAAVAAGPRFSRPLGALLVALAAVHGLFAQLLVISRFYG
jgi:4-amino-4-deoxy-L-arabinose transferase-like glycosyltransferase